MSIINDALKKTHSDFEKQQEFAPPPSGNSAKPQQTSPVAPADTSSTQPKKTLASIEKKEQEQKFQLESNKKSSPSSSNGEASGHRTNPTLILVFLTCFAVAAFIYFPQILKYFNSFNHNNKKLPGKNAFSNLASIFPKNLLHNSSKPAAPSTQQENGFNLQGIMMKDESLVALINGEIYERGNYIQDKEITNISSTEVEILDRQNGGKTTILKINPKR